MFLAVTLGALVQGSVGFGFARTKLAALLVFSDNPYRMDYARDIAKDCQQDIDPEVLANTNLQEHAEGW